MSRTVVEQEAQLNPRQVVRDDLDHFLSQFPATEYSIIFKVDSEIEDSDIFFVNIIPVDAVGEQYWNRLTKALDYVPTIRRYLKETGALQLLYNEREAALMSSLADIKIALLGVEDDGADSGTDSEPNASTGASESASSEGAPEVPY